MRQRRRGCLPRSVSPAPYAACTVRTVTPSRLRPTLRRGARVRDELVELGRGEDLVRRCSEVVGASLDPLPSLASRISDTARVVDEATVSHPVDHSCQRRRREVVDPAELLRGHALGHRIQRVRLEPANALRDQSGRLGLRRDAPCGPLASLALRKPDGGPTRPFCEAVGDGHLEILAPAAAASRP
jgi:hypothetical protein